MKFFSILLSCVSLFAGAQDLTFAEVKKLTLEINSDCEELFPLLSYDKKTLYFVRSSCETNTGGKNGGTDIWVSQLNETTGEWSRPRNDKNVFNDKVHNAMVGIGIDGQALYQLNTSPGKKTQGIFFSKRLSSSWTPPELIPLPFLNSEGFVGLYVSPEFDIILISMIGEKSLGQEDLYVSTRKESGEWSEPRNLGSTINTEGFEMSPFLAKDKRRLYFTSSGHWGLGDGDIFYADRLDEAWEKWTTPINLGPLINSKKFDAYFSIYDSLAYFSSNRDREFSDLYVARVAKSGIDSTQLRIKRIVAEANSILDDLGDDTADSLIINSVIIDFEINSERMSSKATSQLNSVVDMAKRKSNKIKLVAYSKADDLGNDDLCNRRLGVIKNYLQNQSDTKLMVEVEVKRLRETERLNDFSKVEVRYEL